MTPAERPRERILVYGGDALAVDELLALVLGSGVRGSPAVEVGRRLLAHAGGIGELARAPARELLAVGGVGEARAARVAAAFALGRRGIEAAAAADPIRDAGDVDRRLRPRLAGLSQELFVALALDVHNNVVADLEIARGCLTGVDVHPRELFRPLIRLGAAACVVAHNHPSGDPAPSRDDLVLTRRLQEVGALVGIPLLDHVVIATGGYRSVAEILA
jgi:DNA repair protein RadC